MQIHELTAASTMAGTDVIVIDSGVATYKLHASVLADALKSIGNYITTSELANNLTTTSSGKALDARQGVTIKTELDGKVPISGGLSAIGINGILSGNSGVLSSDTYMTITGGRVFFIGATSANTYAIFIGWGSTIVEVVKSGTGITGAMANNIMTITNETGAGCRYLWFSTSEQPTA